MRFRFPWASAAVAGAMILLPLKAGGCGRTACITFSKAKYDAMGTCPSPDEAMKRFTDNCGSGSITSVQGAGVFDGEFCCYDVVQDDSTIIGDCFGGVGGVSTGTVGGFGGVGGTAGFGGFGGGPPCTRCSEAVISGVNSPLCDSSTVLFGDLAMCACSSCGDVCSQSICIDLPVDSNCNACLQQSCLLELSDCSHDF
jgi:hypothetical protein